MITFKVKVKCDRYDCKEEVKCDCELRTGPQGIPEFEVNAPKDWSIEVEVYQGNGGQSELQTLCPKHSARKEW